MCWGSDKYVGIALGSRCEQIRYTGNDWGHTDGSDKLDGFR